MRFLKLIPQILYELKALNSTLADIHRRQIEIREEVENVVSGINALQSSLDIEIGPRLSELLMFSEDISRTINIDTVRRATCDGVPE